MDKLILTATGYYFYNGIDPFEDNKYLKLVKEPDNKYDSEAIRIEDFSGEKIAYVANSYNTILKGTISAGRLYDKIDDISYCKVHELTNDGIICEVVNKNKIKDSSNKVMKKIKNKFLKNKKKNKYQIY